MTNMNYNYSFICVVLFLQVCLVFEFKAYIN